MKIEGKVTSPLTGQVNGESKPTRTSNAPVREEPAAESVDVQVSALATQLREIGDQLRAGNAVDAAKVAEIKQAIAEGRFEIKPDVIADRLLEIVKEAVRKDSTSEP